MIAPEYEQLIQDVLDGVATPEEASKLERWLLTNEAGRARQRELASLFATLARVPLAEAPLDLGRSALAGIVASNERGASRATGNPFLGSWRAQTMRRPALAFAMPFAAGLALGVLALGAWTGSFGPGPAHDRIDTAGSMSPDAGAASDTWTLGRSEIAVRSWNAGDSRFASIRVTGIDPISLELSFDPSRLHPVGLRLSGPGEVVASVSPGVIVLHPGLDSSYLLEFRPASSDVRVQVTMTPLGGMEGEPTRLVGLLPLPTPATGGR
jgi:anti-sigma factor RsiW